MANRGDWCSAFCERWRTIQPNGSSRRTQVRLSYHFVVVWVYANVKKNSSRLEKSSQRPLPQPCSHRARLLSCLRPPSSHPPLSSSNSSQPTLLRALGPRASSSMAAARPAQRLPTARCSFHRMTTMSTSLTVLTTPPPPPPMPLPPIPPPLPPKRPAPTALSPSTRRRIRSPCCSSVSSRARLTSQCSTSTLPFRRRRHRQPPSSSSRLRSSLAQTWARSLLTQTSTPSSTDTSEEE